MITSELALQGMQHAGDMPYIAVLDLRFNEQGSARAIEEEVLLRLKNLRMNYDQLPVDMERPLGWRKNYLMRHMAENLHQLIVITDQPEAVSEFCRSIDVPEMPTGHIDSIDAVPQLQILQSSRAVFPQPSAT